MTAAVAPPPHWFATLGDFRWLRGHISTFFVGVVLLGCIDLAAGSGSIWMYTATGIWLLLLAVHGIVVSIARLTTVLLNETAEEEVVLLPVKDAVIVNRSPDPAATWASATTPPEPETAAGPPAPATPSTEPAAATDTEPEPATSDDNVSWQIATDAARGKRVQPREPSA